ncbi:MAG: nicotinamide riboside transporter PnuC [Flavobacteriales bacterium]|nr:MAG: nicotinamide riboside transporter PnuC [Flavobacteriales bacterium]|tara:strand:- start:1764 stop:2393 length:630 start_codon:yes stop_codon:yes gene_type:complete
MSQLFELLFGQYSAYQSIDIGLEITAVVFGFLSVWYAKKNHIWVFPTGLISTSIFVYLLWKWVLLGDMMINAYYFVMSVYGWYVWTRKTNDQATPISQTNTKEKRTSFVIFIITLVFVYIVYQSAGKWTSWTAYVDTVTTAIFFVGMWLMARRKIENWIFWIVGDIISVPLYFHKGLTFTSLQYLIFTIIAIYGFLAWKHVLTNSKATA